MKLFMSQPLRSSPLRKLKRCVGKEMVFLLLLGTCMSPGGMALTSVTMAGWRMAAFVTQPQWQGPSVVEVYLGWEPCIAMRTKQAFLTQIASLMPTAMNVSSFSVIIFHMLYHAKPEKCFIYYVFCFSSCRAHEFLKSSLSLWLYKKETKANLKQMS